MGIPVLDLMGGLWVFRKSKKISTASHQYFSSYVKKTTAGMGLRFNKNINNINLRSWKEKKRTDFLTRN